MCLCTNTKCDDCQKNNNMPYKICCLEVCGELEFCKGCTKGIYLKKDNLQKS